MNNPYVQYMYSYPHKTAYGPLKDIVLDDYLQVLQNPDRENSLYFHIPFCQTKCGYCNLFSLPGQSEEQMEAYLDAMERQAVQYAMKNIPFSDFTIGGGTPLLLSEKQLWRIFDFAYDYFGLADKAPIIIETSPDQTTKEKLHILQQNHVTRVSIGVQSFQEEELKTLHRNHTAYSARKALDCIRSFDFPCVNLDLIYGVQGQTYASLENSVHQAMEFCPDEVFAYPLYIKKGTYLAQKQQKNMENTYQMYELVRDMMLSYGYRQDSMRRFVRQIGPKDSLIDTRTVRTYQSCGFNNTISIGCGGRSYIDNLHFCTPYGVEFSYCKKLLSQYIHTDNYKKITHGYILDKEEQKRRYVIKHLLFQPGIHMEEYEKIYEKKLLEDFSQLVTWQQQGYAVQKEGFFSLTEKGIGMSDYLGPMLISPAVREKMQKFESEICQQS